jgi:hypothetical protein
MVQNINDSNRSQRFFSRIPWETPCAGNDQRNQRKTLDQDDQGARFAQ